MYKPEWPSSFYSIRILFFVIEDAWPARYDYKCLRIPVSLAKATTLIVTAIAGRSLLPHETLKH